MNATDGTMSKKGKASTSEKEEKTKVEENNEIDQSKFNYGKVVEELRKHEDHDEGTIGYAIHEVLSHVKYTMDNGFDGTLATMKYEEIHRVLEECKTKKGSE